MADHISFREIEYITTSERVLVTVITDIPSHLWLRRTAVEPRIHRKSGIRRGYPFIEDLRFCFTVYWDWEQREVGETLTHTWCFSTWPVGAEYWHYLWGEVGGVVSVSTSPIFHFVNRYIPPYEYFEHKVFELWSS